MDCKQKLCSFFDFSPDLCCVSNDTHLLYVNDSWEKALGWTKEELTSRPFRDFIYSDDLNVTSMEVGKLHIEDYSTFHFRNRYYHKDGQLMWLSWSAYRNPEDNLLYASARMVNDRVETEEKLVYYKNFYNEAPIGFYRTTIDDGKFLIANPLCWKMLGCNSQEKLSTFKASDYYANEEDRNDFIGLLSKNGGHVHSYEVKIRIPSQADHQKNQELWVVLTGRINKEAGYLEGSIMDITYRKIIEADLNVYKSKEVQRLKELNSKIKQHVDSMAYCDTSSTSESEPPGLLL